MNSTTGAFCTQPSIAVRVSVDKNDRWRAANLGESRGLRRGRRAEAYISLVNGGRKRELAQCKRTADRVVLENILLW